MRDPLISLPLLQIRSHSKASKIKTITSWFSFIGVSFLSEWRLDVKERQFLNQQKLIRKMCFFSSLGKLFFKCSSLSRPLLTLHPSPRSLHLICKWAGNLSQISDATFVLQFIGGICRFHLTPLLLLRPTPATASQLDMFLVWSVWSLTSPQVAVSLFYLICI